MGGLASGATNVYIPEDGIHLSSLAQDVNHLCKRYREEARFGIPSEGRVILRNESTSKETYTTDVVSSIFRAEGKGLFDSRTAVLGHLQQGGIPSPLDRIRAVRLAVECVDWLEKNAFHHEILGDQTHLFPVVPGSKPRDSFKHRMKRSQSADPPRDRLSSPIPLIPIPLERDISPSVLNHPVTGQFKGFKFLSTLSSPTPSSPLILPESDPDSLVQMECGERRGESESRDKEPTRLPSVYTTRDSSACVIGIRGADVEFTSVIALVPEANLRKRMGKEAWWMDLKLLIKILSKYEYESEEPESTDYQLLKNGIIEVSYIGGEGEVFSHGANSIEPPYK